MKTINLSKARKSRLKQTDRPEGLPESTTLLECAELQNGKAATTLPRASSTRSRAETALFATLGLTAAVAILIAVVSDSVPAGSNEKPFAALGRLPVIHYIHSGRLLADARTAAEMVRYFFASDKCPATNATDPGPSPRRLAMPTNNAAGGPKA